MPDHTIRIKGDTWEELKKYAFGFQTPDDALRLILGLEPAKGGGVRLGQEPYDAWVLQTDSDIEELATNLATQVEEVLEQYQDEIIDRVVSLFQAPCDPDREDDGWPEFERLHNLAEKVILRMVSENLMSAYKMPGGGEDDGEEEDRAPSGRQDHPSNSLRSV